MKRNPKSAQYVPSIMRIFSVIATAILISGCTVGIERGNNNPSVTFIVPIGYQEAYRRADASTRFCHSGSNIFLRAKKITGNVYTDVRRAELRVTWDGWSNDMVRVNIEDEKTNSSKVTIAVWGGEIWDEGELVAIRRAIETGTPTCR